MTRNIYPSASPWEDVVGYSLVVKTGNIIEVAGTTATDINSEIGLNIYYEQTKFILSKIEGFLNQAGASMKDVTRTRIFVCDISKWEEIAKAHAKFFKDIKPVTTMVEVERLIAQELFVEIEVTAVIT